MPTIDTRIISGQGVLKLPITNPDIQKAKILTFFFDVIRPPTKTFSNKHYNPNKANYAYICWLREGYVVRIERMEFLMQAFEFSPDISAQNLYAIKCAYSGELESFANLGSALGLSVVSVTNQIKSWSPTILYPDTCKIVCESDTAIQVVAKTIPYDICTDDTSTPTPPPPPPPPPTKHPPGDYFSDPSSSPISPPYNSPDDGGDTVPFGGDKLPAPPSEFPIGNQCAVYALTHYWTLQGFRQQRTIKVWGKIEYVGLDPADANRYISINYGDPLAPGAQCLSSPRTQLLVASSSGFDPGGVGYSVGPG